MRIPFFLHPIKLCLLFCVLISITPAIAFSPVSTYCLEDLEIHALPIQFDSNRKTLTYLYQVRHYQLKSPRMEIFPEIIVVHWTGLPNLDTAFKAFEASALNHELRPTLSGDDLNVSAHFLVDRDGTIYQLMPDNWMARHVIGLNLSAIGIENVGGVNHKEDLTEAQLRSNVKLIRYLKKKYPHIHYLIGHYQYLDFEQHALWREKHTDYRTKKYDPGQKFMEALWQAVHDLKLETTSAPAK